MSDKIKVNIADAPWQECDCGGLLFEPACMVKRLSALVSPDGKEHNIPVDVMVCTSCKKIPSFLHEGITGIPENLKAIKKLAP